MVTASSGCDVWGYLNVREWTSTSLCRKERGARNLTTSANRSSSTGRKSSNIGSAVARIREGLAKFRNLQWKNINSEEH
jgi:hypothetical protein